MASVIIVYCVVDKRNGQKTVTFPPTAAPSSVRHFLQPMRSFRKSSTSGGSSAGGGGSGDAPATVIKQAVQDKAIDFIKGGNIEALAKMLEEGNKENKFLNRLHTKTGKSSLMVAAEEGRVEAVVLMLDNFANLELTDKSGMTAFLYASLSGETEIAELLAKGGTDKLCVNDAKENAIHLATKRGHLKTVQLLVDLGVPLDECNATLETPLMNSIKNEQFHISTFLLEMKANINILGRNDNSVLIRTAFDGRYDTAMFVIQNGGEINVKNINGETALMIASKHNHDLIVQLLLDQPGIEIDGVDLNGKTSLMLAAMTQRSAVLKILLRAGADINVRDVWGYTAMHYAVNSNVSGGGRISALLKVEKSNDSIREMLDILVSHGAWINAMDKCYRTPLMHACQRSNLPVAEYLLQRGANYTLRDQDDRSAEDLLVAALEALPTGPPSAPSVASTPMGVAAATPASAASSAASSTKTHHSMSARSTLVNPSTRAGRPPLPATSLIKEGSQSTMGTEEEEQDESKLQSEESSVVAPLPSLPAVTSFRETIDIPVTPTSVQTNSSVGTPANVTPAHVDYMAQQRYRFQTMVEAQRRRHRAEFDMSGVTEKPEWIRVLNDEAAAKKAAELAAAQAAQQAASEAAAAIAADLTIDLRPAWD